MKRKATKNDIAEINNPNKYLTKRDKIYLHLCYVLLGVVIVMIIVPLAYVLIASFMDPVQLANAGITFDFRKWSLDGYRRVIHDNMIWRGFFNSIVYSVGFTFISVLTTIMAAYPLSRKDFKGRRFFNTVYMITMFFGGGLMPTYLTIQDLGMINTPWALILPNAVNVWNIILARTYYTSLPGELHEAAELDGCNDSQYFFRIMFPVCMPIVMVLILYQFVAQWNGYFDAMIYLEDEKLQPLQLVIRSLLIQNTPRPGMVSDAASVAMQAKISQLLKYSTIIISSVPLFVMYPFFAKYFEKGIMIGSVKG